MFVQTEINGQWILHFFFLLSAFILFPIEITPLICQNENSQFLDFTPSIDYFELHIFHLLINVCKWKLLLLKSSSISTGRTVNNERELLSVPWFLYSVIILKPLSTSNYSFCIKLRVGSSVASFSQPTHIDGRVILQNHTTDFLCWSNRIWAAIFFFFFCLLFFAALSCREDRIVESYLGTWILSFQ